MPDQIKIKFVKAHGFVYPKPYVFKITPKDHKEFGDQLKPEMEGMMINPLKQSKKNPYSHFKIIAVGHFDDELHKPLKIDHMLTK